MTKIGAKSFTGAILEAVNHFSVINGGLNLKPRGRLLVADCLHVSFKFRLKHP